MTPLELFVTAMGIIMAFGYYPQAYQIYKNKSGTDVSFYAFGIFAVGTFTWALYGFYIENWIIILSFVPGVVGSWLVLGLKIFYAQRVAQKKATGL